MTYLQPPDNVNDTRPADGEAETERLITSSSSTSSLLDHEDSQLTYTTPKWRVITSFFLFGVINNVLYVIILSAALDLVPSTTPKGVVLFFNIFPALLAKVLYPYILTGPVIYSLRVLSCLLLSVTGILLVAFLPSLPLHLLGISLASFSSGLGELTYLQLSTSYKDKWSLGAFASGTGGAGILGAGLWWLVKGWGVRKGLGSMSVLPVIMAVAYWGILKSGRKDNSRKEDPLRDVQLGNAPVGLSIRDKWILARPLIGRFMCPLFFVYLFEYTINQGISPTLLYPLPAPFPLTSLLPSPRDFYPLYQLTYQTFVFLSRSSHILNVPPIPIRFLSVPSILQGLVLMVCLMESTNTFLGIRGILVVIALEGLCGGAAYVNVYHHVGRVDDDEVDERTERSRDERTKQEKEWRMGVVGAADSLGILFASLISMPIELGLCQHQVEKGMDLCRTL
ncbi:Predicted small molecule transporter involved in cellular pH homeostasis (Batten disease protein in human) [Phaffia rhodozyma]|uniref:Protein BTN n=1 Tax=Phaffia rhodozyma TaxID=264483 RepID=A0A0F7SXU5_PHARH|nr:Predicted small molecule transporter involved in cellular pH homeostasis (Batten disease protein in human) [Phaffia rhodozyma]